MSGLLIRRPLVFGILWIFLCLCFGIFVGVIFSEAGYAQQTISNLPAVVTPQGTDLFMTDQVNPQSPTGYSTRRESAAQLASIVGGSSTFQPSVSGSRMTPLTVTTGGTSATLPTGAQVVISNVGSNPMYCNVVGLSPATTSDQLITANGGWFQFTPNTGATTLNCISTGGTTTANGVGGAGLPTGTGGGSGAGAVTLASGAVASGAYSSGSIASGAVASGAVASGAFASGSLSLGACVAGCIVDLGNNGSVIAWHNGGGGTPYVNNILAGIEADLTASAGTAAATVPGSILYTGINVGGNLVGLTGTTNGGSGGTVGLNVLRAAVPVGGATPGHILSAASNNSTSIKGSAGTLYSVSWANTNATGLLDIRFYDTASAPTCSSGTGVKLNFVAENNTIAAASIPPALPSMGIAFANGIGVCITGANADNDNTNATTGLNLNYSFN